MEKEFIPYEQALALKELGFDKPCVAHFTKDFQTSKPYILVCEDKSKNQDVNKMSGYGVCLAPLYQQAFRWFREKYDLDYSIKPVYGKKHYMKYRCNIYSNEQLLQVMKYYFPDNPYFDNREEAEIECLKKLIEIVKNK
jgi:hypothetical protein